MLLFLNERKLLFSIRKIKNKYSSSIHSQNYIISNIKSRKYSCQVQTEPENVDKRKINIIGLTKEEMKDEFKHFGIETYRADQVWHWLYNIGIYMTSYYLSE